MLIGDRLEIFDSIIETYISALDYGVLDSSLKDTKS